MKLSIFRNNNPSHVSASTDEAAKKGAIKAESALHAELATISNSQHALLGKTIAPQTADKTLDLVRYDGTGTIRGFKGALSAAEISSLAENVIPALKDTPVSAQENKILTPGECLISLWFLIKKSGLDDQVKQTIFEQIKANYLAGEAKKSVEAFCKKTQYLHAKTDKALLSDIGTLINSLEEAIYYTKHTDNYFGRLFETRLAEKIVNDPSPEMQKITQILMDHMAADFEKHSDSAQRKICASLSSSIKKSWDTWYSSIPEVTQFSEKSTAKNFLAMLNTRHPLKPGLAMSLAVKYIIAPTGLNYLRGKTFFSYNDIIQPQRYWNDTYISNQKHSNRTGIQLTYQMKEQNHPQDAKGGRPIDKTRQNVSNVFGHDKNAFMHEKPVGVGMSGSSNLLDYLFFELKKKHEDLNHGHARLLAASSLVHSGGHSFNECWTVFNRWDFTPLPYNKLLPDDAYMTAAIDYAWDKMTEEAAALYS